MAISVTFNGATIYKPGSYSKTVIDLGGNFPLSPVGVVGLIGEADRGLSGAEEIIESNVFTADRLQTMVDKYGPGSAIADAASFAFSPSNDAQIVNGANAVYVYKTNTSIAATGVITDTVITQFAVLSAREPGVGGNLVSVKVDQGQVEVLPKISGLTYLPTVSPFAALSHRFVVNGASKVGNGLIAGYDGAVGGADSYVAALPVGVLGTGGTKDTLFAGIVSGSVLTPTVASPVNLGTQITLSGGGSVDAVVVAGDSFVISGTGGDLDGTYLATAASTASTLTGLKLKDLTSGSITVASAPVSAGVNAADILAESQAFKPIDITVAAQAQKQGASLQFKLATIGGASAVFGGSAEKGVISPSSQSVATIDAVALTSNSLKVSLSVGAWLARPVVGDFVWILQDSQLAGVANANCGAYIVTASTAKTVTLLDLSASGACVSVTAAPITAAGVIGNLRCFVGIFQYDSVVAPLLTSESEASVIVSVANTRDQVTESSSPLGGTIVLSLGYAGASATAATMSINQATKRLTTSITGVSGANLSIDLSQFADIATLVNFINAKPGYIAVVDAQLGSQPISILDEVSAVGILSQEVAGLGIAPATVPGRVKKDLKEVSDYFAASSYVEAQIFARRGLPEVQAKFFLANGSKGATSAAAITAALDQFAKVRINSVVPLFSRDAEADVAEGFTDEASSYMIDAIHAAVKSHCILMSNTKNRSERHCMLAIRSSFADVKVKSGNLGSARAQLVFQDVRAALSDGQVKWHQPHVLAAGVAGMRSGAEVGLPLTFKFMNISGLRHTASPLRALPSEVVVDFDPRTQADEGIIAGVTFLEAPQSGGFRLVLDNTTYNKDDNWLLNRGSVAHAADVIAFDFRRRMEQIIVGQRNSDFTAASIRSIAESLMAGYSDQRLTAKTEDAPNGFKQLSVRLEGNVVRISVTLVLAEGIDFVLSEFTLTRNVSAA